MATDTTSAHSTFVKILAEVGGVSVMAILADTNDEIGSVLVAIMVGWVILALMTNTAVQGILTDFQTKLTSG
jgi:hypothetical protein